MKRLIMVCWLLISLLCISGWASDFALGGGGPGVGLFMPYLEEINTFLSSSSFPSLNDSLILVGGGGRGGLVPGLTFGGAGWGSWTEAQDGDLTASFELGLGGFDIGFTLGGNERSAVTLGLLLGAGGSTLEMTGVPGPIPVPLTPSGIIPAPANQTYDSAFAVIAPYVDMQVHPFDWIGFNLRAGFVWTPLALHWQDEGLPNPPDLSPDGVYLRFSINFGGIFSLEPIPVAERLQQTLDRAVAKRRTSFPGAVLFVDTTEIEDWAGASGIADIKTSDPMNPDSRFGIGSIAKPFVAVVILQLMEEGFVDLDARIGAYLPEDIVSKVSFGDQITVRMLLNHTSGIAEWLTEDVIQRITEDLSIIWELDELLILAQEQEPYFLPGESFAYSNTDYTLLGMIIEAITGNWWGDEVRARILEPLELANTIVREPGDNRIPDGLAHGYAEMGGDLLDLTAADPSMAGAAGGNAMVSTTTDLAHFISTLLAGELFASQDTLDQMLEWVDAPDDNGFPYWYGLGLEKYVIRGDTFIGHAGGAVGYVSVMYVDSVNNLTIVASANEINLAAAYVDIMLPAIKELTR
jgi:D-alanyl-D-alanine carboxypeptidase